MFHPLPLYVGLRYARARAHRYFVSFITWVSLAGVAVGVAALIVILSVMNGFESELRSRLLSLSDPVRLTATGSERPDWQRLAEDVGRSAPQASVERFAAMPALAVVQPEMFALTLRSAGGRTQQHLAAKLVEGSLEPLLDGEGILLGTSVAQLLGVVPGDRVTLLTMSRGEMAELDMREFPVAGLFEVGIEDHDAGLAFASLQVLEGLGAARSHSEGLSIHIDDSMAAPALAAQLRTQLAASWPELTVTDWTAEHGSYFRAIRIEKTMMAIILLLIVAVAAFNIVAMLVMVVTDKRTDIAILRTFGASPRRVAGVFVTQGLVIGWTGVLAGTGLGWAIAANVGPILGFLYEVAGISLFDPDVYYITEVPSELQRLDVLLVATSALVVTALATIYPALRAAGTSPAEALRYE
jgi:lipoprotein-releasing system permease protein